MKWGKVPRTIYPVTVYFCQGGTTAEIEAKLKRLKLTPEEAENKFEGRSLGWTMKLMDSKQQFSILIWIDSCKRNPKNVSVIAHECLHAVYYTFEFIGQEMPKHDDQEFATYYLDYLVSNALKIFWRPQLNTVDF